MIEMKTHTPTKQLFANHIGNFTKKLGLGEATGKVWSSLLIAGKPLSQYELSDKTGYSLGIISSSLKVLESLGVVRVIGRSGQRRLYVSTVSLVEFISKILGVTISSELVALLEEFDKIGIKNDDLHLKKLWEECVKAKLLFDLGLAIIRKYKSRSVKEIKRVLARISKYGWLT